MADAPKPRFPTVNLLDDRERVRRRNRPLVRTRFWVALLASSVIFLVVFAVVGIRFLPALVQR